MLLDIGRELSHGKWKWVCLGKGTSEAVRC